MASRPKLVAYKPNRVLANNATTVYMEGQEFQVGATLQFGALAPAVTVISENRISFNLPNSLSDGIYDVILTNPDGGWSNTFEFPIYANKSVRAGHIHKDVDQRVQPLPPPLQTRTDSQRVVAGNQYTGRMPIQEQGRWLDGSAPTQGGRWAWAEDCIVTNLEFQSNGVEPGIGRQPNSAFYKVRKDGSRIRILGLDQLKSNDEYIVYEGARFKLGQGEEIQLITTNATLEMIASVTVEIDRPYL